jgi:hypothetical protein
VIVRSKVGWLAPAVMTVKDRHQRALKRDDDLWFLLPPSQLAMAAHINVQNDF